MKTLIQSAKLIGPRLALLASLAALSAPSIFAQDASGNSLLSGAYRFRYVATLNYNSAGNVIEVTAAYGVITFDGKGNYVITAGSQYLDNTLSGGKTQSYPTGATGVYTINSAGLGTMSNPDPDIPFQDVVVGSLTNGVFTGSSTESGQGMNDLFVAIAVGAIPTNATFTSPYWIGALDFAAGSDADVKNALLQIKPDGKGNLGSLAIQGQANSQKNTVLNQTVTGGTYNFASDGGATLTIPAPSGVATPAVMFSGSRTMYVSNDGNYLLGWTNTGYDIFFGVKALTTSATDSLFSGLYYISGLGDQPPVNGNQCLTYSFWGSENADGKQDEIMHQRLWQPYCSNGQATDFGTDDYTQLSSDGTAADASVGTLSAFGVGGKAFVAISNNLGTFGLSIGIQAPSFSPSGVFLNPVGVVNAASWGPVTTSIAPGELLTLFGSNLAAGTSISTGGQQFPTMLGNVQVSINGAPAPIYYVSPTQISVIAPYSLSTSQTYTATIQVNNAGLLSNIISVYLLTDANSGIFAQGQNGIGDAIAFHATPGFAGFGTFVTESSPAAPGETLTLALTGMGLVTPPIADGAVPSTTILSYANNFTTANQLLVLFNDYVNGVTGVQATVTFAGLYPGLAGLYQMNVTVPTTVGPGDVYVEVITDSADVNQVTIPVAGAAAAAARAVSAPMTLVPAPRSLKHQNVGPRRLP